MYRYLCAYLCIYLLIIILMNHDVEHLWKTINSTTEMEKLLESSSKSSVKISWDEHLIKYGLYAININDPGFLGKFLDSAWTSWLSGVAIPVLAKIRDFWAYMIWLVLSILSQHRLVIGDHHPISMVEKTHVKPTIRSNQLSLEKQWHLLLIKQSFGFIVLKNAWSN